MIAILVLTVCEANSVLVYIMGVIVCEKPIGQKTQGRGRIGRFNKGSMSIQRRHRILVVDDEPLVCESVAMLLAHDGHDVETAASGEEALSKQG